MTKKMVEWSDELATGILWQDFQHTALIAHINRLHQAIIDKRAQDELWLIIKFLESYIENHFGIEERYMEVFNDPLLREHARAHQQFRSNLSELKQYGETGAQLAAASLCYDLYDWVTHHIRTIDRDLARLLQKKSVQ